MGTFFTVIPALSFLIIYVPMPFKYMKPGLRAESFIISLSYFIVDLLYFESPIRPLSVSTGSHGSLFKIWGDT